MNILVFNKQKDLILPEGPVKDLVRAALENVPFTEVAIYFVTQKAICDIHADFFNDPSPTDCITFPNDSGGEVFVCPKTALLYTAKKGLDPYRETALYIIHGLLHLQGYNDLEEKERRIMRKKEKSCMDRVKSLVEKLRPL